jgi:hypothetical protein
VSAKFKPNSSALREMLRGDIGKRAIEEPAKKALAAAEASAPIDSGEYRASLRIVEAVHPSRVVNHVGAHAAHGMKVEANTGNLARSLDSAR